MNYGVFVDNIIYGCDDLQIVCYNLYAYLELFITFKVNYLCIESNIIFYLPMFYYFRSQDLVEL